MADVNCQEGAIMPHGLIEQFSVNAKYVHDSCSHAENKENRR